MSRRLAWLPAVRLMRPVTAVIMGRGLISNHITSMLPYTLYQYQWPAAFVQIQSQQACSIKQGHCIAKDAAQYAM